MSNFPDWVKVQFFDIDQYYNMADKPNYQEMDDIIHGDLNRIAAHTNQDDQTFGDENEDLKWKRVSGCEAYITFIKDNLVPPGSKVQPTGPGLDDEDEFESHDGMPNIGLVFNDGVYKGHGLGADEFSKIIEKHFDPYRGKSGDYDAILDAALKEVYDKFTVGRVDNRIDDDGNDTFVHETWSV